MMPLSRICSIQDILGAPWYQRMAVTSPPTPVGHVIAYQDKQIYLVYCRRK